MARNCIPYLRKLRLSFPVDIIFVLIYDHREVSVPTTFLRLPPPIDSTASISNVLFKICDDHGLRTRGTSKMVMKMTSVLTKKFKDTPKNRMFEGTCSYICLGDGHKSRQEQVHV